MKVLIIAEACNPDWVSVPLVGWSLANALRNYHDVHIVTQIRNREALLRMGLTEGRDFTSIDSETMARPLWRMSERIRGGAGKGWTTLTAVGTIAYYYFEYLVWKRFRFAIESGDYDLVHRITPLSPTTPSLIAKKCHRAKVPFLMGPLNGGVPWPKEFDAERRQEKEWLSYIRSAYKLLPGYRGTIKYASALLIGSGDTLKDLPKKYHDKCIYLPENAIDPSKFSQQTRYSEDLPVRACFVGRLVPYKGPDMLIDAAIPLLKAGKLELDIIGDGPLMPSLAATIESENLQNSVFLRGWVKHEKLQHLMCQSQIFAFPSVREFGGGAVLEAMSLGLVPLIVDYAGPSELVTDDTGYKVPVGTRAEIVSGLRRKLAQIIENRQTLNATGLAAKQRVKKLFTWEVKGKQVSEVYDWILAKNFRKPVFLENS